MNSRSLLILGVAAAMMAGTSAFLMFLRTHQKLGEPGVKISAEPMYGVHGQLVGSNSIYLPERISNFTSKVLPVDDKILEWLPRDTTYGQRMYQGTDGFHVQMSVVLMGTDRTSIHRPQFCLPAQGWVIEKEEARAIRVEQPYSYLLPVMHLKAHMELPLPDGRTIRRNSIFTYWFVSAENVTAVNQDYMWSMLKHLLLKGELERWAYVSCFSVCNPGEEERAFQRTQELVAAAVPQFQLVAGPRETAANAKGLAFSKHKEGSE